MPHIEWCRSRADLSYHPADVLYLLLVYMYVVLIVEIVLPVSPIRCHRVDRDWRRDETLKDDGHPATQYISIIPVEDYLLLCPTILTA